MPHALLAGAPTGCWTNLGDEAILAGMIDSLRAVVPDLRCTVVTSSPPETYPPYGCDSVRYDDLPAVAAAVAASDAVVLGGGSIFFDYWGCDAATVLTPRHSGVVLWAGLALLAAADGIPVMTYDVGVGPLHTADGRLISTATFQLASQITVRDNASRDLLVSWGLAGSSVTVTGDPAIRVGLPVAEPAPGDAAGPVLGVSVRQWDTGPNSDRWHTALARAVDTHLDRAGGRVMFVACHRAVRWPLTDDEAAAAEVIGRMRHADRATSVPADMPWRTRAALLSGCDALLAMRYHAALFGLRAGVPTVALSYDAKVRGLLDDWGLPGRCLSLTEATADPQRIADLLGDPATGAAGGADGSDARTAMRAGSSDMLRRERAAADLAAALLVPSTGSTGSTGSSDRVAGGTSSPAMPDASDRDAVRELLSRMPARNHQRPTEIRAALDRLGARLGGVPDRRTVAILTNRLVHPTTGKPHIGGAERYTLAVAELLRDLDFHVDLYQGGGDFDVADFHGFPVHPIPFGEAVSEFQIGIGAEFHRRTADVDHVLYLMPNYACGPMRDDAVVVSHGVWWDHDLWSTLQMHTPAWREQLEGVFTRPRRVISVDANTANVVRGMFPAAGEKIRHVPSFVDTRAFAPPPRRRGAAGRRSVSEPVVLFPRRAETVRGSALLGPILDLVPDPCRFAWVGTGSKVSALRELAQRDPRLSVATASFAQMPRQYADADICVIPSVASEGQSLSCLEAMASGLPVVVTRVGALPELVTDGVDGLVCDPTPQALAAAIRRLVRDPGLRRRLGAAARRTALRHGEQGWRAGWVRELAELGWVGRDADARAVPYDIVKFPVINFEQRYQRPQQMAVTWARRGRRVFYIRRNGHLPMDGPPLAVTPIAEGVYEVSMALPAGFNVHARPPGRRAVAAAMAALAQLRTEWNIQRAVSVVELGTWEPIAAAAREQFDWPMLYDCMDNWATFPGFSERPAFLAAERTLVATADAMTVSGEAIQRRWATVRPDAALARNAADFDFFRAALGTSQTPAAPAPDTIADISGPIAGFIGSIEEWFDVDLVTRLATERPAVTFVVVGNVTRAQVDALRELPNVRFLGLQPYADMPAYLRRFDVCLVPFIADRLTASMDLVKVYEYLALGKPVVCTPVAEMLRYRRYLYLAEGADEFLAQLDRALAEDDPDAVARRVAMARLNSWDDRIEVLEQQILPALTGERRRPPAVTPTAGATTSTAGAAPVTRAATPAAAGPIPARAAAANGSRPAPASANSELDSTRSALGATQQRLAATQAKLDSLNASRALRLVRRYWMVREAVNRTARRAVSRFRRTN